MFNRILLFGCVQILYFRIRVGYRLLVIAFFPGLICALGAADLRVQIPFAAIVWLGIAIVICLILGVRVLDKSTRRKIISQILKILEISYFVLTRDGIFVMVSLPYADTQ